MADFTYETLGEWLLPALERPQPTRAPLTFTVSTAEPCFLANYPEAIRYAEGRIYKELVLLATRTQSGTLLTTAGQRALSLSVLTPTMVVPEGFALVVSNERIPFDAPSLDWIDEVWPNPVLTAAP